MTTKNEKTIYLQVATMIDPATEWIEIRTVTSARVDPISDLVFNVIVGEFRV